MVRIAVIGAPNTGKSALIHRITDNVYDRQYEPTERVVTTNWTCSTTVGNIEVEWLDVPESAEMPTAEIVLLAYDLTKANTYRILPLHRERVLTVNPHATLIMVGCFQDSEHWEISPLGVLFPGQWGIPSTIISSSTNYGIQELLTTIVQAATGNNDAQLRPLDLRRPELIMASD